MTAPAPGCCRHCRCRGESCGLENGEKCVLAGEVCNARACLIAEERRLARVREERRRERAGAVKSYGELAAMGWGHGAIVEYLDVAARHRDWTHGQIVERLRQRSRRRKRRAA